MGDERQYDGHATAKGSLPLNPLQSCQMYPRDIYSIFKYHLSYS